MWGFRIQRDVTENKRGVLGMNGTEGGGERYAHISGGRQLQDY
jgi:hypothetical protein